MLFMLVSSIKPIIITSDHEYHQLDGAILAQHKREMDAPKSVPQAVFRDFVIAFFK